MLSDTDMGIQMDRIIATRQGRAMSNVLTVWSGCKNETRCYTMDSARGQREEGETDVKAGYILDWKTFTMQEETLPILYRQVHVSRVSFPDNSGSDM